MVNEERKYTLCFVRRLWGSGGIQEAGTTSAWRSRCKEPALPLASRIPPLFFPLTARAKLAMLKRVAPHLSPHTEYMYGYDQEVVSRENGGEVGRPEAGGPQGNENPERRSKEQLHITLHVQEERRAQEAGGDGEKEEHRIEKEEHRQEEEHHIEKEEHGQPRDETSSIASHEGEARGERGDGSGHGCWPVSTR